MKLFWLTAASVALSGFCCVASQQDAPPPTPPPIADGATAFKTRGCAQCHQIEGVGGHKGPDLSGVGRRLRKDAIEAQIVKGGEAMPAFGEALDHAEVVTLVEYLHKQRAKH